MIKLICAAAAALLISLASPVFAEDLVPVCDKTVSDGVEYLKSAARQSGAEAEIRTITGAQATAFVDAEGRRVHQKLVADTVLIGTIPSSPAAMILLFNKNCFIGRNVVDRKLVEKTLGDNI